MDPKVWGPVFWSILFESCKYVDSYKNDTTINDNPVLYINEFLRLLSWVLPCSECRASFNLIIQHFPPSKCSSYLEWIWAVRNIVNQKLQCDKSSCIDLSTFLWRAKSWKHFATPLTVKTMLKYIIQNFCLHDYVPCDCLSIVRRFVVLIPKVLPEKVIDDDVTNLVNSLFQHAPDDPLCDKFKEFSKRWVSTIY